MESDFALVPLDGREKLRSRQKTGITTQMNHLLLEKTTAFCRKLSGEKEQIHEKR
jgi:hypothetical protein